MKAQTGLSGRGFLGNFTFGAAVVMGLLGAALTVGAAATPPKVNYSSQPIDRTGNLPASFAPIVKKVANCVVNIYSTRTIKSQAPDDPFLRRFFGGDDDQDNHSRSRRMESAGSGVIVSDDGYILTNNHVVDGADVVKVALADDRGEYTARVVGADAQSDVAVIKIEAKGLKSIVLGDSDQVEVGDVVLAVGNPFGLEHTVTKGIVSAMGRAGFGELAGDFIQTDAPINPGNSGGALIDIQGRLIGINQSIISRSGGSQGVGFAVPINVARSAMDSLVTEGIVRRGFLGVGLQPLTADLAKAFNMPDQQGALIREVRPNTPAAAAGIKEGDVIIAIDGKSVRNVQHMQFVVAQTAPKSKVTLKLIREGKEQTLTATLGTLPKQYGGSEVDDSNVAGGAHTDALNGVEVTDLDTQTRREQRIPTSVSGALVTSVQSGSAAEASGLRTGDVITSINRNAVENADAAAALVQRAKGDRVLLRVWSTTEGRPSMRYLVIDTSGQK